MEFEEVEEPDFLNGAFDHLNRIIISCLVALTLVVVFIVYIIHLYDTGVIGPKDKPKKRSRKSPADRIAEQKFAKKYT